MAIRPIYIPSKTNQLVDMYEIEFEWFPGFSVLQKQRSIEALHNVAKEKGICLNPLEISTKSNNSLGVSLSAFNLSFVTKKHNRVISVESAFQGSKKFENGGPFSDLFNVDSRTAKRDERLKTSGNLTAFIFFGEKWPLKPKTLFYDWIYLKALQANPALMEQLEEFDGFTDIEFNPKKSINCQAHSVALFKSLKNHGLLKDALQSKADFIKIIGQFSSIHDISQKNNSNKIKVQQTLF